MADPQLVQQLRQTVSIAFSTATANEFGEVSVSTSATQVLCRIQAGFREYEKIDGTELRTLDLIIFNEAEGFTPTYEMRIWMPGTSTSTPSMARRVHTIHCCIDEFGNVDHWEVGV